MEKQTVKVLYLEKLSTESLRKYALNARDIKEGILELKDISESLKTTKDINSYDRNELIYYLAKEHADIYDIFPRSNEDMKAYEKGFAEFDMSKLKQKKD